MTTATRVAVHSDGRGRSTTERGGYAWCLRDAGLARPTEGGKQGGRGMTPVAAVAAATRSSSRRHRNVEAREKREIPAGFVALVIARGARSRITD